MIIKKLAQTRKASEDMENTVLFATEEAQLMALAAYESDTVFEVDINPESSLQSHGIIKKEERI